MKKKLARATATLIFTLGLLFMSSTATDNDHAVTYTRDPFAGAMDICPVMSELTSEVSEVVTTASSEQPLEVIEVNYVPFNNFYTDEDIELIARVAYAEAEGECDLGQRLVVDTILNRVDSPLYPDTVSGVVYQQGQFDIFDNGRFYRVELDEHIIRLVNDELNCRTHYDVLYFNSIGFNSWSEPIQPDPVGNHYFSKQKE